MDVTKIKKNIKVSYTIYIIYKYKNNNKKYIATYRKCINICHKDTIISTYYIKYYRYNKIIRTYSFL